MHLPESKVCDAYNTSWGQIRNPDRHVVNIGDFFPESFIGILLKCQEVSIWNVSGVGDQPENLEVEREFTSFYFRYRKLDKVAQYRIMKLPKQLITEF
jgi:hypothetical protein